MKIQNISDVIDFLLKLEPDENEHCSISKYTIEDIINVLEEDKCRNEYLDLIDDYYYS